MLNLTGLNHLNDSVQCNKTKHFVILTLLGLGCSTVLSPEAAAQFAAQILGLNDHLVWAKLRASMLNTWVSLKQADKKMQECSL